MERKRWREKEREGERRKEKDREGRIRKENKNAFNRKRAC